MDNPQPPNSNELCHNCKAVDFHALTSFELSREEALQVRIDHLNVVEARHNGNCPFCQLIIRCAELAGLDSTSNATVSLKPVRKADPAGASVRRQIYIEYFTMKFNVKKVKWKPATAEKTGEDSTGIKARGDGRKAGSVDRPPSSQDQSKEIFASNTEAPLDATGADSDFDMQQAIAASLQGTEAHASTVASRNPGEPLAKQDSSEPPVIDFRIDDSVTDSDEEDEEMQRAIAMSFQQIPATEKQETQRTISKRQLDHSEGSSAEPSGKRLPRIRDTSEAWDRIVQASWLVDLTHPRQHGASGFSRPAIMGRVNHNMLRWWQTLCDKYHDHPTQVAGVKVPLSEVPLQGFLRAINTKTGEVTSLDPTQKFAALSYHWGPPDVVQIAETSETDMIYATLPRTVRDAMQVAIFLKYDWLWVDRICIEQDNPTEKALLMAYMKDIFAAADLTIVAATGDVNSGLPGISYRQAETIYNIPFKSDTITLAPESVSFNAMLSDSPWNQRGWPFEEQIFSRRLLYFFPNEVFFTCSKETVREGAGTTFEKGSAGSTWGDRGKTPPFIGAQLHAKLHGTDASSEQMFTAKEFLGAVREYSSRSLTLEEDRINAFAGIVAAASRDQDITMPDGLLLHGHPIHIFETLLTWHGEEGAAKRMASADQKFAPSWSWASAGTKVHFLDDGEDHTRNRWFQLTQIDGFDVVGIPQAHDIPMLSGLRLGSTQDMIEGQPWLTWLRDEAQATSGRPQRLPILHMLTIIFDGLIGPVSEYQHCLRPLGSEPNDISRVTGSWSIDDNLFKTDTDHEPPATLESDKAPSETPDLARRMTFALVGGYQHMYIMLLSPEGEDKSTFSRLGLFRLGLGGFDLNRMTTIAACGDARWEYIRIV